MIPFHAGHSAVVIFFVLSGYVITYVASERETTLRDYALSRCARIYAVAVPTLLLTIVLDLFLWRSEIIRTYASISTEAYGNMCRFL